MVSDLDQAEQNWQPQKRKKWRPQKKNEDYLIKKNEDDLKKTKNLIGCDIIVN